jgi:transporter family protein
VVPIDRLSLLLVALIGFAFLGERPSATGWTGLLLIAGGGILLSLAE